MAQGTKISEIETSRTETARPTPSMAQYLEIKCANPDCILFFQMGDFYEMFFEDAETASRALGIALTKRGKNGGEDIPMCGFPHRLADNYLHRLIALGHKVALCEQTEDPQEAKKRGSKAVVRREVTRLVTAGTLTEDNLLDPSKANYLLSLSRQRDNETTWHYGFALVDISTGHFSLHQVHSSDLASEIARLGPREIIVPESIYDDPGLKGFWRETDVVVTPLARDGLDAASSERRLKTFFNVTSLDGFGAFSQLELTAAGGALFYIERTQLGKRPHLLPPVSQNISPYLHIDAATRASLELVRTSSGEKQGSLLNVIDRTLTASGGRLLAERLSSPLTSADEILRRQKSIELFLDNQHRDDVRALLKSVPDLARALSRLAMGRGGPRDLACVKDGLKSSKNLTALLATHNLDTEIGLACQAFAAHDNGLSEKLALALGENLPLLARDGNFVREGYSAPLNHLRALQQDSRQIIAALQNIYAADTQCRTLRIKHNAMLGFYIEVPPASGETLCQPPWRDTFIHRQTMMGAMRFSTAELQKLDTDISSASEKALELEKNIFEDLMQQCVLLSDLILAKAQAFAVVDVSCALAQLTISENWVCPIVDNSLNFHLEGARHPVVEAALKQDGASFVANDCNLSPKDDRFGGIILLTGPNMGGKSTYLRQNALIVVLAQMGSYVPAAKAHIGLVDRLFSRVGASDDLARGRSTFMVEMIETASILNQASERSLVVLDEIGRGTSTFDGLSIAWAAIEHLHQHNRCRALFATHFHELTALDKTLSRLANMSLKASEWNHDVVFLHEIKQGPADRSYGLQVAKLAGLPVTVLKRATSILKTLEQDRASRPAPSIDDLPLFAAKPPPQKPDALREAVNLLDPDSLTPKQALEAIYGLKAKIKNE